MLFCSTATIASWQRRFEAGGVEALLDERRGRRRATRLVGWALVLVHWVTTLTPREFGYCRSRWSCATLALVLYDEGRVRASAETVRRALRRQNLVWRRPRQVLVARGRATPVEAAADPRTAAGFAAGRGGRVSG